MARDQLPCQVDRPPRRQREENTPFRVKLLRHPALSSPPLAMRRRRGRKRLFDETSSGID